jgi:hypothetical protein
MTTLAERDDHISEVYKRDDRISNAMMTPSLNDPISDHSAASVTVMTNQ